MRLIIQRGITWPCLYSGCLVPGAGSDPANAVQTANYPRSGHINRVKHGTSLQCVFLYDLKSEICARCEV